MWRRGVAGSVSVADTHQNGPGSRKRLVLRPYQQAMREWAWERPFCALWADMGLGKTPTTLMAMADALYDRLDVRRWLVVGPKLVVEDAWPRQLRAWQQTAYMPWRLFGAADFGLRADWDVETGRRLGLTFGGRGAKREAKLRVHRDLPPVCLVSWDWLPWLVKACGRNWPFDGLVLDEAIFAQDSGSVRHKAVWHVVHGLQAVSRVIELTGAPVPNGYEALHGQIRLLDGGARLGKTKEDFRAQWLVPDQRDRRRGVVYSWKLAPGARAEIDRRVSDLCVALRSDDYLSLPPVVQNPVWVELPPAARELYDRMERDLVVQVDGAEVLAESAGVLVNKLLQIAGGCVYDGDRVAHAVHDVKLDRLAEVLEGEPGPVLLAYPFRQDWDRLRRRFRFARHVHDAGALDAFRAGRVKLLCMHPASGGHGVDGLQEASQAVVWLGATYNADHWLQFNARVRRDGQRGDVVRVHQLLAAGTIEEYVAGDALQQKLSLQQHLLRALMMRYSPAASSNAGAGHGATDARAALP